MQKTEGTITALLRFQIRSYGGVVNTRRVERKCYKERAFLNLIIDPNFVPESDAQLPHMARVLTLNVGDQNDFVAFAVLDGEASDEFLLHPGDIVMHIDELSLLEKLGAIRIDWTEPGFFEKKHMHSS